MSDPIDPIEVGQRAIDALHPYINREDALIIATDGQRGILGGLVKNQRVNRYQFAGMVNGLLAVVNLSEHNHNEFRAAQEMIDLETLFHMPGDDDA